MTLYSFRALKSKHLNVLFENQSGFAYNYEDVTLIKQEASL